MPANQKKILIGIIIGLAAITALLVAYMLGQSTADNETAKTSIATATQTTSARTTTTPTVPTNTSAETTTVVTPPEPAPPAHGPYDTAGAASAHVASQEGGMRVLDPGTTWQPGAALHVIHATPEGSASYGGDFYYFFVDGYQVGMESFTSAQSSAAVDGTTFSVTFNVYLSTDPHCCPSGGLSTVQFYWDGGSLTTIGSMAGATM